MADVLTIEAIDCLFAYKGEPFVLVLPPRERWPLMLTPAAIDELEGILERGEQRLGCDLVVGEYLDG